MFKAIGISTETVYATGVDKAEVFRNLSTLYPTKNYKFKERSFTAHNGRGHNKHSIYPEPLKIKKGGEIE